MTAKLRCNDKENLIVTTQQVNGIIEVKLVCFATMRECPTDCPKSAKNLPYQFNSKCVGDC